MSWTNWLKPDFKNIKVPEWVRYVAQDSDGFWWGYSVEPLQNHRGWYENEVGEHIKLLQSDGGKNWQESLISLTP